MKNIVLGFLFLALTVSAAAQTQQAPAKPAYNFEAVTMDGSKLDTAALRGKLVVFNLWFINCPNCIEEIARLNQLVADYSSNKDVVFIGLAASRKLDVEKFLKKNPFNYTIVPDATGIILTKFGTPDKDGQINVPFPMHFVLDRDGNAVVQVQGTKGIEAVKTELARQFSTTQATAK
jgi:peroxiredoxin